MFIKKRSFLSFGGLILSGLMLLLCSSYANESKPTHTTIIDLQKATDHMDVLILFKGKAMHANDKALVKRFKGKIKRSYSIIPGVAARIPRAALAQLKNNPRITSVEIDAKVQAHGFADDFDDVWGIRKVKADQAQENNFYGHAVKVAILDSGIDFSHPELSHYPTKGYDFVNSDDEPFDDDGHGTHVAGTVAAKIGDHSGVGGVSPNVDLYALKVLDSSGSGSFSDIIAALQWCVDNNINITNNSYGSSSDPGSAVQLAFDNATNAGVFCISSAGNSGRRNGKGNNIGYPARYDSVMAVAATTSSDSRASFSSTGPTVEIAAPGQAILSSVPGGAYESWNGTSMACPHVVGAAALLLSSDFTQSPATLRSRLNETAIDLGDPGLDNHFGHGLVDVMAALNGTPITPGNTPPTVEITSPADNSLPFISGALITFEASVFDNEDSSITEANISWSSSIDGTFGTNSPTTSALSDGIHTISASVIDSGGLSGSDSISITIGDPPESATDAFIDSITYDRSGGKSGTKDLIINVSLMDNLNQPIANASVSINLNIGPNTVANGSGSSDSSGLAKFRYRNAGNSVYNTKITALTAGDLSWDGISPPNSSDQ